MKKIYQRGTRPRGASDDGEGAGVYKVGGIVISLFFGGRKETARVCSRRIPPRCVDLNAVLINKELAHRENICAT